jgi:hypothetical protein
MPDSLVVATIPSDLDLKRHLKHLKTLAGNLNLNGLRMYGYRVRGVGKLRTL